MRLTSIALFVFACLIGSTSHAETVFTCDSDVRKFTISKTGEELRGFFLDFNEKKSTWSCSRRGRGYNFHCLNGEYIAKIRRNAYGQVVVDFELKGDFYPDSGYLFQITCKNIRRSL